jgi:hypothetical protein
VGPVASWRRTSIPSYLKGTGAVRCFDVPLQEAAAGLLPLLLSSSDRITLPVWMVLSLSTLLSYYSRLVSPLSLSVLSIPLSPPLFPISVAPRNSSRCSVASLTRDSQCSGPAAGAWRGCLRWRNSRCAGPTCKSTNGENWMECTQMVKKFGSVAQRCTKFSSGLQVIRNFYNNIKVKGSVWMFKLDK